MMETQARLSREDSAELEEGETGVDQNRQQTW